MSNFNYKVLLDGVIKEHYEARLNVMLHIGCREGNLDLVKYVLTSNELEKHADIHSQNNQALMNACHYGHLDIVKYLLTSPELKKHANIHADRDGAIESACIGGHIEIIKYLTRSLDLKSKIDITKRLNRNFEAALKGDNAEVLNYFIVDLNIARTKKIDLSIRIHGNQTAEKLFSFRNVHKELQDELNIEKKNKKSKIKI